MFARGSFFGYYAIHIQGRNMMSEYVLKLQNDYSWLLTDDKELLNRLWLSLRVPAKNYWMSSAYQQKRWDGMVDFFKKNSGMFATGLLPEIHAALRILKKPYTTIDNRTKINWQYESIDNQFLNKWLPSGMDPISLHDYQVDYVHQAYKFNRGLITAPAGAGKTYIMISILKSLPPKTPVLFMTKAASLVDQNYKEMQLWGLENVGRYYGGHKEHNSVMCVTVHKDTFEGIKELLPLFKVLIVDEVHECMSDVPVAAYKMMKNACVRLGFSATAFKYAGKDKEQKWSVKSYFGPVFKTTTTESGYLTTKALQERGILSPSRCTFYPMREPNNIMHEPYGDAVTLGIANNIFFHQTVQRLARSLKGRTLILVERIDQGEYLKQLLPEAHWIYGNVDLDDRFKVFKELKHGDNVVAICMRQIVTAGINVFVHNMINASGGQAEHNIIQQMGRGLRCADDKEILNYFDFMFKTNPYLDKHSKTRIKTLRGEGHEIIIKEAIDF